MADCHVKPKTVLSDNAAQFRVIEESQHPNPPLGPTSSPVIQLDNTSLSTPLNGTSYPPKHHSMEVLKKIFLMFSAINVRSFLHHTTVLCVICGNVGLRWVQKWRRNM